MLGEDSNHDFGGEITEEDFQNAENPLFDHKPKGGEWNDDAYNLFQGDIMLDEDSNTVPHTQSYYNDYFSDVSTLPGHKWPKINNQVIVPYTIPSTATKQDKAHVARVIIEFRNKTCVR